MSDDAGAAGPGAAGDARRQVPDAGGGVPAAVLAHRVVAAVCAHPDDETFGLGAVISTLVGAGVRVELVCLTRGEASTLGTGADLWLRRREELGCAARTLGIDRATMRSWPDGRLRDVGLEELVHDVAASLSPDVEALLVFDEGGISGHPDHRRATEAAVVTARRLGLPVLGWALPRDVATTLAHETGTPFVGREEDELHHRLAVDRSRQLAAMSCHASQLTDNHVPARRMELQGPHEHLRELHRPGARSPAREPGA